MRRIDFNKDWDYRQAYWEASQERKKIDLPHDYSMELLRTPYAQGGDTTGYFNGGEIVYSKELFAPAEWENKTVLLEFEGVYMNAVVKLNGNIIKKQPYGYTTFHAELDRHLNYGEINVIEVKVANVSKNSRWYSGTGIYRPVWLMVAERTHIKPWGTYIVTENVTKENADIKITTSISATSERMTALYRIFSPDGEKVVEKTISVLDNKIKAEIALQNPLLWDIDNPNLYRLTTILQDANGNIIDDCEEVFGIREISITREHGFELNGNPLKLKGGCVHHDNGIIGAASYRSSEER